MRFLNLFYISIAIICFSFISAENFKASQKTYTRVQHAYSEKESELRELYKQKKVNFGTQQIFLRAFKSEKEVEVWARSKVCDKFTLIKTYPICSSSGTLGPKRKEGDRQVPEGYYYIDRFNPQSNYYLSMGINYPNASDRILGNQKPGNNIYLHGSCVTIGCIPLTDNLIKEIYILGIEARNNGQTKIPIHIYPFKMNDENFENFKTTCSSNSSLIKFWENIKPGYDYFEKNKILPKITVQQNGLYRIS
jgi:murein L,D-transpeptidase YafK